ncbi:hypothetical protein CJ030_MR3G014718 [Morella rubra]|uniref:Uncharacterized protein n=1 Tax=Morella rubra TaxID=262757 RepID=A0A6A1VY50_9ROSI|nr:hypothetical protein CJ030_MR3G014718 [Morella rubra]
MIVGQDVSDFSTEDTRDVSRRGKREETTNREFRISADAAYTVSSGTTRSLAESCLTYGRPRQVPYRQSIMALKVDPARAFK